MTAAITLDTKAFGPTGFEVELNAEGEVLRVSSAAAQLPEMVFRITYGDRWEYAREHFQRLAENLKYRVEAAAWLNDALPEYKLLRRAFRKTYPEAQLQTGTQAPLHAQRATFWLNHPEARPGLFLQKKRYSGFGAIAKLLKQGKVNPNALEPWLFSLISLLDAPEDRSEVYHLIGLLGTSSASEYLFSELERPGRHPYSTGLLNAVREVASPENSQRILDLHPFFAKEPEQLREYLKVVSRLRGQGAHAVIISILDRHSSLASEAFAALKSTNHPAPGAAMREKFNQEESLHFFDLIAEIIDEEPEGVRISLAEMNAKVDTPTLNAAAPVTWPQMLGPYWAKLVKTADEATLLHLVSDYLGRNEPWLQRCALLQLDTWIQAQASPPAIPLELEQRMRQLVRSRYEKVYTVVLNIAEKIFDRLAERGLMVDLVFQHARTSRYRLMNAAVLKKAAGNPILKEQQIALMRTALAEASAEELPNLKSLIPYLRFLASKELFRKLAGERQEVLAGA
jgi:hypothetical protein